MSHSFYEYKPKAGDFETRRNGVLISFEEGVATFYALKNAEDRGVYFIKPVSYTHLTLPTIYSV